jgi:hypothetical protein
VFSPNPRTLTLLLTLLPFRLRSSLRQFDLAVHLTQWKRRRTLSALVRSHPLSVAERSRRLDCVLGCCSALVRCSTAYQRVMMEIKIAEENEVVELFGVGAIKSFGLLGFSSFGGGAGTFMATELACHQHNCFSQVCCRLECWFTGELSGSGLITGRISFPEVLKW